MKIIKRFDLIGALFAAVLGMIICTADLILLYLYLIVTSEKSGIINIVVCIILLISDGPIFLLQQKIIQIIYYQKKQVKDTVIVNTLALGSVIFFVFVLFLFPMIQEIKPITNLMYKTSVRDDITLFFCQTSACIGASICFMLNIFKQIYREK